MMRKPRHWSRSGRIALAAALFAAFGMSGIAAADDVPTINVTIQNHRFTPSEIQVPAGQPVILHIQNNDATVEEFDSSALQVEKVIVGGAYGNVRLRPLGPGRYPFMGEYHPDTAQGVVVSQ